MENQCIYPTVYLREVARVTKELGREDPSRVRGYIRLSCPTCPGTKQDCPAHTTDPGEQRIKELREKNSEPRLFNHLNN